MPAPPRQSDDQPWGPTLAPVEAGAGYLAGYTEACNIAGHIQCPQYSPVMLQRLGSDGARSARPTLVSDRGPSAVADTVALVATGRRRYLFAFVAVTAEGPSGFDVDAMTNVFPQKREIVLAPLSG